MDPALIDRTTQPILGISDGGQLVRTMTIAGIESNVPAKILSTNLRGSSTRMVRLESGWGSRLAGAFTADVEVFVLKGDIEIGSVGLGAYEYAAIPGGGVVGGFRSRQGAIALMITSGPIRYDTSTGGAPARIVVGRPSETSWHREFEGLDIDVRPIATSEISEVWLGSTGLSPGNPAWHKHPFDEETFVLEGELQYRDFANGEIVTTDASPGSYFYRPAGWRHCGPLSVGEETPLMFHRSLRSHQTELLESEDVPQV